MAYLTLVFIVLALVQSSKGRIRALTSQSSEDPVDSSGHGVEGPQKSNPSIKIYTSTGGDEQMHTTIPGMTGLSKSPHLTMEERTGDHEAGKHDPEPPIQHGVFKAIINHKVSHLGGPCAHGLSPCAVLTNPDGTNLLWDDMSRTLTFAWELHVFGSASLFILLAGIAVLRMASASTLLHPLCDSLNLANGLLLLTGILRAVLLLLDPYGTCQILSRPVLAALHNMAPQLLLWVQVALTLVALRGMKLVLLPLKLQQPRMVGGLVVYHCTVLLLADLLSPYLSSALPLLLQTLSVCWGLSFCIGVFIHSVSHSFLRTSVPQWGAPQMIETRVRRLTAVCSVIGVLCCGLHMYSVLWLYGLLGNWRRFGWGWWLSQFWARILELAWSFSLLVLGSWISWTPHRSRSRSGHGQARQELSEGTKHKSCWGTLLTNIRKGPFRKSEENWENLMPNNWARYKLCLSNNTMHSYDDQVGGPRECILSLIEVDMHAPSPINLRRTIDNAFHHGHLAVGSLFALPPPSWTSADNFQGEESMQSPRATADQTPHRNPNTKHQEEGKNTNKSEISATMHQQDWSDDDLTDL